MHRFYVEDFPAIAVIGSRGDNLYETERSGALAQHLHLEELLDTPADSKVAISLWMRVAASMI
ncbi:MAG: hypothetical protein NUV45_09910 [Tepidanaerobacteraceae bacterium]|nr:hypothetical protein [Tepidanaerobacteraceae bacterium]